jgi:NADH:ubiquinone oxidoreductase subunit 3 (subunit A)
MSLAAYCLLFVAVGAVFIVVHLLAGRLIRPNKPGAEKGSIYECGEPTIGSAWIQFDLRFYVVALLFVIFDVEVAFFFPWAEVFGRSNAVAAADRPTDAAGYRAYAAKVLAAAPRHADPEQRKQYQTLADMDPAAFNPKDLEELRAAIGKANDRLGEARRGRADAAEVNRAEALLAALTRVGPDYDPEALQALSPRLAEMSRADLDRLKAINNAMQSVDWSFSTNAEAAKTLSWTAFWEVLVFFGVLLVGFAYLWRRGDLAWVRSTAAERPAPPAAAPAPAPAAAGAALTGAGRGS